MDHENILIALLGAFGIVVAATIPVLWVTISNRRQTTETRDAVKENMPQNGAKLWEMLEAIEHQLITTRVAIVRVAERLDDHLEDADAYRAEVEPLVEFVKQLMVKEAP